ncbi:MAG: hypothetical protein Kow0090_15490 [Myxococcota bacterium]
MIRSHKVSLDKKKMTKREQILQADEFLQKSTGVVAWLEEHQKAVLVGLLAILVAAFGFVGARSYIGGRAEKLSEEFYRVMEIRNAPIDETLAKSKNSEDKKEKKISGEIPKVFESAESRNTYFIQGLEGFIKDHPTSKLVGIANLYLGNAYREKKEYEEAIKYYEKALEDKNLSPRYTFLVLENLGYTYEEKNDIKEALNTFKKLSSKEFYGDAGLYHQGRMLMKEGKKEEAKELFKRVLDDYPESLFRMDCENRLKLLN